MKKIQILQDKVLIDYKKVNSRRFFSKLEKNIGNGKCDVIEEKNNNSIIPVNEFKVDYNNATYEVKIDEFEKKEEYENRLSLLAKLSKLINKKKIDFSGLSEAEQKYCLKVLKKIKNKRISFGDYISDLVDDLRENLSNSFTEAGAIVVFVSTVFSTLLAFIVLAIVQVAAAVLIALIPIALGLITGVGTFLFEFPVERFRRFKGYKDIKMEIKNLSKELKKQFEIEKSMHKESNVLQNENNEEIDFYETHKQINKKFKKMRLVKTFLKKHKEVQPKDIKKLEIATDIFKLVNDKLEAGATLQEADKEVLKLVKGFLEEHKDILENQKEIQINDVNEKEHVKTY